jgi:hypothetical protein
MKEATKRAFEGTGATLLLFVAAFVWYLVIYQGTGAESLALGLGPLIAMVVGILAVRP